MEDVEWVVIDTETTGFATPIFVVELAAQRMRGWQAYGEPFRRLLNHGTDIPPEASRVNGYTREILERDGDPPHEVYREFAEYVGTRHVSSYNLAYDWDGVLLPEWLRIGLPHAGTRGFCILKLAQRLLDPTPAGNCKLQTLRQFYRLPERGAHTALGNVETAIDLARNVLRPLTEARGLKTLAELVGFSESIWFPARISFGKFKGRLFREARSDQALRAWLEWLAASSDQRSVQMGTWYLAQLDAGDGRSVPFAGLDDLDPDRCAAVVIYTNPYLTRLRALVEGARDRLAELESVYTRERQAVASTEARLFDLLRPLFQKRDLLKLRLNYRRRYLDTLLESGEEEAAEVEEAYEHARNETNTGYDDAAQQSADKRPLNAHEQVELKSLWRELVKLFHPDRVTDDEGKKATYQRLMAEINRARDSGDIDRLREIAHDPLGFIARQGWSGIELCDGDGLDKLQHLYETLQAQILNALERLDALHDSPECELHQLVTELPGLLNEVAAKQRETLEQEITNLHTELERVDSEIGALQE